MLLTGITEGADWISKTSLSPDSLIALLWRVWQMLEQHEQLKQNASSTKLGSTSPPLKVICNLWVVRIQGQWFYMYEGKGKIETRGKKFPPNDEVPSNIRQVCGSGNMLFAFHEFVQKWIIAEAQEALEIHWANSKQINRLYSTCICKNKKHNIQRSQGADVWQLIPASDVYLPVALF